MLAQVVYETNADLDSTQENMIKNPLVVADKTEKGMLWFKFKENRTIFQLSPFGKLQVRWSDLSEKQTLFRLVKNLLIAKSGEKLLIKPLKQQTWIDYPVPETFKLYWCDKATEFTLKTKPDKKAVIPSNRINDVCDKNLTLLSALRNELCFFREPTMEELECRTEVVLPKYLHMAGWIRQSEWDAKYEAEQAINLAGWLRFKKSGEVNPRLMELAKEAIRNAPENVRKRAGILLKNYPSLIPTVRMELAWQEETKKKWKSLMGDEPPASKFLEI